MPKRSLLKKVKGFQGFEAMRGQRGKVESSETITIRGPATLVFYSGVGAVTVRSETREVCAGTIVSVGYEKATITATKQDVPGLFVQEISFFAFR